MGLKLELVKAEKGDCLLLHYGKASKPALALVDGGAPGAYEDFLEPRLTELRDAGDDPTQPLPLELVMISHIDQDHIAGVYSLLRAIELAGKDGQPEPYAVARLWHNAFKRLTDASEAEVEAAKPASDDGGALPEEAMVIAAAKEGSKTSDLATRLGIPINEDEEGDLLLAGDSLELPGGLELTVLGPTPERIEALRKEWEKEVKAKPGTLVPASVRETVTNLSSLLVVAEYDGKRLLLTGDGIAEDILAGLEKLNLLDANGRAHFDVLKMPHHGSAGNISDPADFLQRITADHYAISGNGEHGNPELETLRKIVAARGDDGYEIWLTYEKGEKGLTRNLETFADELKKAGSKVEVNYPKDGEPSMTIDLG
jgi:hypothetical protein